MPYTAVTRSSLGAKVIAYARGKGVGHDGSGQRNQLVTAIGMVPDEVMPFEQQMNYYWKRASARTKIQTTHVYQSFSRNELDPEDYESILTAGDLSREFAKTMWPDHQVGTFIQTDGASGLVHVHYVVNNISMTDDHRALDKMQTWHEKIKQVSDEISAKYITLDPLLDPQSSVERVPRAVRVQREKNIAREAAGEAPVYIWQDDLKARVSRALETASDMDAYKANLAAEGVELTRVGKPSAKHPEGYLTYRLTDMSGFPGGTFPEKVKSTSSRSYKLGPEWDMPRVKTRFAENEKRLQEEAQRAAAEAAAEAEKQAAEKARREAEAVPAPAPPRVREEEVLEEQADAPEEPQRDPAEQAAEDLFGELLLRKDSRYTQEHMQRAWQDFRNWRVYQSGVNEGRGYLPLPSLVKETSLGRKVPDRDEIMMQFDRWWRAREKRRAKTAAKKAERRQIAAGRILVLQRDRQLVKDDREFGD